MTEMSDLKDLYRELILDHARTPRNFGKLVGATHEAEGINPLCGDKLHLYLQVADDKIRETRFEGSGCAISVASASLLTETIAGVPVESAESYFEAITTRLTQPGKPEPLRDSRLDKLRALEGVRDYPARVKCATLAWHALHAALQNNATPATTE